MSFPIEDLKVWFLENKRDFPWRSDPSPYKVWVSEIMLQQTQATHVVPYFEKWMKLFPTINDLAQSSEDQVFKAWEGLGYYSRARNLHQGAKYLAEHFGGVFNQEALFQIKGIGSYTSGAILNFAFHQKKAAVDGNVLRVIARYQALEKSIDESKTKKEITDFVESILPESEPWLISEALIELGALVCQKKAKCQECPLSSSCKGKYKTHFLPIRKEKKAITTLFRAVAVITYQDHFLLIKGEKGKVMGELYEFPYLEMTSRNFNEIQKKFEEKLNLRLCLKGVLKEEKHTFTRFRAHLFPLRFEAEEKKGPYHWEKEPRSLAFSSGHKRVLERLMNESTSH